MLGIKNVSDSVENLDEDEKGIGSTETLGGHQTVVVVSESGLYALIFRSRKPNAVAFRKWVTSEVLPALRTTERYEMGAKPLDVVPPSAASINVMTNSTIVAVLANGKTLRGTNLFNTEVAEVNTAEGTFAVKFEGWPVTESSSTA